MSEVQAAQQQVKRAIVYVDGFNFYYGVLKHGPNKWLNLERFFCRLRQHDQLQRIRYFTARISGCAPPIRKLTCVRLTTLPLIDVSWVNSRRSRSFATSPRAPIRGEGCFRFQRKSWNGCKYRNLDASRRTERTSAIA